MGIFIGIDYGIKRIGLACTDLGNMIASALTTVQSKKIIPFLKKYNEENPIEKFIVGKPKQKDGKASDIEKEILGFIDLLHRNFPSISVERYDERYTSKIASNLMKESGLNKKRRKDKNLIDKISATIILQSYLESNVNQKL